MALRPRYRPDAGAFPLALLVAWTAWSGVSGIMICPSSDHVRRMGSESCYLYHHTPVVFSAANRTCVRAGSTMLVIQSEEESTWINENMFQPFNMDEFWIGMHDQDTEGTFRWIDGTVPNAFTQWADTLSSDNTNALDCVKFTASGWTVHSEGCGVGELPFICESPLCESDDQQTCNMPIASSDSSGGVDVTVIAVVIILVVVIIVVVVLVIVLVFMWKFHNDAFNRYCCCCLKRGSKVAVHSLQQENQRLRHELSQHKLSLTGSGRYSQGMFGRELSGVPDGRGGVLPTIKQAEPVSPTIYEDRPLSLGPQPPPLVPQRGYTRVAPALTRFPSQTKPPLSSPGVFTPGPRSPVTLAGLTMLPTTRQLSGTPLGPLAKPPVKRNIFGDQEETKPVVEEKQPIPDEEEVKPVPEKAAVQSAESKEQEESEGSSDDSSQHES